MAGSYGYNVRWAYMAAGGSFTGTSVRLPVVRDTIGLDNEKIDSTGTTGTRSMWDAYQRDGADKVAGQIEFAPSYTILNELLPYIMGSGGSGTFTLADTLPDFDRLKDMSGKIVKHTGLKVAKAELSFGPGLLKLVLDCVGKAETSSGLTWSSASLTVDPTKDRPYAFQDCTVTIMGSTRKIRQGVLTIDNGVEAIYSSGSLSPEEIMPQGARTVTLTSTHPTSSTEWDNIYNVLGTQAGNDGAIAWIVLETSGDSSTATTTFTLRKLRAPRKCPVFDSKGEIFFQPQWQARHDGTNPELSVTTSYA